MFKELNFYQIYFGLKLLNILEIKNLQNNFSKKYNQKWDNISNEFTKKDIPYSMSHINYLKLVKENYSS